MTKNLTSVRLFAGLSENVGWTFTASISRALFRVGSGMSCNWRIQAPGVLENHFMLLWDGSNLTLIDVGAGVVRVDGQIVRGTAIVRTGRVEFGGAAIVIDSNSAEGVIWQGLPTSRLGPNDLTLGPTLKGVDDSEHTDMTPAPAAMAEHQCNAPTIKIENVEALLAHLDGQGPDRRTPTLGVPTSGGRIEWHPAASPPAGAPVASVSAPWRSAAGSISPPLLRSPVATVAATPRSLDAVPAPPSLVRVDAAGKVALGTPKPLDATRQLDRADPGNALVAPPPPPARAARGRGRYRPASLALAVAVGVVVCAFVALGGGESDAETRPHAANPAVSADAAIAEALPVEALPAEGESTALVDTLNLIDEHDPLASEHCKRSKGCELLTVERVAADLVSEGRYEEAIVRYELLARREGGSRFGDVLTLLRSKVSRAEESSQ